MLDHGKDVGPVLLVVGFEESALGHHHCELRARLPARFLRRGVEHNLETVPPGESGATGRTSSIGSQRTRSDDTNEGCTVGSEPTADPSSPNSRRSTSGAFGSWSFETMHAAVHARQLDATIEDVGDRLSRFHGRAEIVGRPGGSVAHDSDGELNDDQGFPHLRLDRPHREEVSADHAPREHRRRHPRGEEAGMASLLPRGQRRDKKGRITPPIFRSIFVKISVRGNRDSKSRAVKRVPFS